MTRAEIIGTMAEAAGWSKVSADRALRVLLGAIRTSLKRGQPVTLVGFGTFSVSRRKARRARNPRTGLPMQVTAGKIPRFRPSRDLRRAVR
jgi:DNA-binding protein HU-beta